MANDKLIESLKTDAMAFGIIYYFASGVVDMIKFGLDATAYLARHPREKQGLRPLDPSLSAEEQNTVDKNWLSALNSSYCRENVLRFNKEAWEEYYRNL